MTDIITLPRSVVEQALQSMRLGIAMYPNGGTGALTIQAAIDELRAALEQPQVKQEPVEYWTVANGWVSEQAEVPAAAWVYPEFWDHCKNVGCGTAYGQYGSGRQPLYTCPQPKREPLTAEHIGEIVALKEQRDELLEALEHVEGLAMADDWRDLPEIVRIARAAIAKATGE